MQRMTLGKTGLNMYRVGFGGIPIQRVSEEQAVATVRHAVEAGVDFIDTSRMYTTSEHRIGLALAGLDKQVTVATKSVNRTADGILADIEISRRELQREQIDLYQCHFVNDEQTYGQIIDPGGALEGLYRARKAGLIGHIGLTSHNLDILDRVIDDGYFETIMVCFGILEPRARERIIPKALAANIGVIAMKTFSGGVIEKASLAMKFGLAQPKIMLIPGVETPDLFDENWTIFQEDEPLTAAESAEIARLQKEYDRSFCRRCDYCQPCPQRIPIQLIMGLPQMVKRMGSVFASSPFARGVEAARTCTSCGQCEKRCPYKLPVPKLIRENLAWYDEQMKLR